LYSLAIVNALSDPNLSIGSRTKRISLLKEIFDVLEKILRT